MLPHLMMRRPWRIAVATIFLGVLRLLPRVVLAHKPSVVWHVGVVLLRVRLLFLASATVSPTFGITAPYIFALCLVMPIMLKVCQRLGLVDGFIYGLDLSPLQLRLGPILQPVHEVEHHIFIREVGNLKS